MLVYSENITPRISYVVHFMTRHFLKSDAEITSDREYFLKTECPKFSYCKEKLGDALNIIPSGFLYENGIRGIQPDVDTWNDLTTIFPVSVKADIPFDLLAGIFYLLSRYEEYLPFKGDKYGRFMAEESIAFQNGFLEQPVIDKWILKFMDILKEKYPELNTSVRNFRFIPTVDVDMPYEYLNKGTFRSAGGAVRSLLKGEFKKVKERSDVLRGERQDPFYTFDRIQEIHDKPGLILFFLTAGYGKYDKGIDPESEAFKKLVNHVSFFSFIGIHPSWKSDGKPGLLEQELKTLSRVAEKTITRSRQHYLMIHFPDTFNRLCDTGITEDYSMGYSSHVGFRAGTCTPFRFYDLKNERETSLVIYPFQVMDRTLKDYMKLQPAEATRKIAEMIVEVRAVNGTFISIFHNETFSDSGEWEGWLEVYKNMLDMINN